MQVSPQRSDLPLRRGSILAVVSESPCILPAPRGGAERCQIFGRQLGIAGFRLTFLPLSVVVVVGGGGAVIIVSHYRDEDFVFSDWGGAISMSEYFTALD